MNCFAVLLFVTHLITVHGLANYKIWCDGNCDVDAVPKSTTSGVVLMGGGTDTNEAFMWQSVNANGGDFVVIRTSGDDAYNTYIMGLSVAAGAKLNSVRSVLFRNKKASSEPEVLDVLRRAEAIFMAGGDQSEYLDYWVGTEVQSIIQDKLGNITIGGTSAGCAVLGNWVYSGEVDSVTSEEALADPYHPYITIRKAFLHIPYLESIITDTHFVTRDRMGRMNTFMARILKDIDSYPPSISRAVGIDEHTALLLDSGGRVQTVGVGTAYFCESANPATVCLSQTPLTFQDISCVRLSGSKNDSFSFVTFRGDGVSYTNDIISGKYTNIPYGPSSLSA